MARTEGEVVDELRGALRALEQGQRLDAAARLLSAWRDRRHPRLAEVLERLDATMELPEITAPTREKTHARWVEIAERGRVADLSRLLAGLGRRPLSQFAERLSLLLRFAPDPRLAMALARFIEAERPTSAIRLHTWSKAFRALEEAGDVRVVAPVQARMADPPEGELGNQFKGWALRLAATLSAPPPALGLDANGLLDRIDERVRALPRWTDEANIFATATPVVADATEDQLLKEIFAAPAEDAPRLVYADWLTERGDPRGTFIRLQFTKNPTKAQGVEERRLLKANAARWLGPLEKVIWKPVFERGFLASGSISFKTPKVRAELIDHPFWSTLREITGPADEDFLLGCALPDLRAVFDDLPARLVARMAVRDQPYALERLTVSPDPLDEEEAAALRSAPALARVTHVSVSKGWHPDRVAWLLSGALGERVRSIAVYSPDSPVGAWLEAAGALRSLLRFEFSGGGICIVERDGWGEPWRLDLGWFPDFTADRLRELDRWLVPYASRIGAVVVRPHHALVAVDLEPILSHLQRRLPSTPVEARPAKE